VPEQPPNPFRLSRFLPRAIPLAVASAVLWQFTREPNAQFTITIVKSLHNLLGFPAPYLFCDETRLFWNATMFPPVVALVLASYWLPWWDRILRAVAGYVAHAGMTAIAIAVHESPYLAQLDVLAPITSTLVNANYLMFGLVIWVLIAGPWYSADDTTTEPTSDPTTARQRTIINKLWGFWGTRIVTLWITVAMILPIIFMFATPDVRQSRLDLARTMRAVPTFPHPVTSTPAVPDHQLTAYNKSLLTALSALEQAIKTDIAADLNSSPLWFLTSNLWLALRPEDPKLAQNATRRAAIAFQTAKRQRSR
jgi:hypothetical protein